MGGGEWRGNFYSQGDADPGTMAMFTVIPSSTTNVHFF